MVNLSLLQMMESEAAGGKRIISQFIQNLREEELWYQDFLH